MGAGTTTAAIMAGGLTSTLQPIQSHGTDQVGQKLMI